MAKRKKKCEPQLCSEGEFWERMMAKTGTKKQRRERAERAAHQRIFRDGRMGKLQRL